MGMNTGGQGGLNAEINVTPLVDVMLVLLIIFMVTAPMLQTGVDLELPQVEAQPLPTEGDDLRLSLDKNGHVFLGGKPIKWAELEEKLATNAKIKAKGELYIEADKNLAYGLVLRAMATARRAGVHKLMMVADPLDASGEDMGTLDEKKPAGEAPPPP
jgi:biopolymer transport protein TolR